MFQYQASWTVMPLVVGVAAQWIVIEKRRRHLRRHHTQPISFNTFNFNPLASCKSHPFNRNQSKLCIVCEDFIAKCHFKVPGFPRIPTSVGTLWEDGHGCGEDLRKETKTSKQQVHLTNVSWSSCIWSPSMRVHNKWIPKERLPRIANHSKASIASCNFEKIKQG